MMALTIIVRLRELTFVNGPMIRKFRKRFEFADFSSKQTIMDNNR